MTVPGSEEELLVQTTRRFAESELAASRADADRNAAAPASLDRRAAELGLFADAIAEELGGILEGPYSHRARVLRGFELGRGCPGLAALCERNVETALAVSRWGGDALQREVLPGLAEGGRAAFWRDSGRRLQIDKGGGRLSGTTTPIACGADSEELLLVAEDENGGSVALLISAAAAKVEPIGTSAWRAARWARWTFDGVEVAPGRVLCTGEKARGAAEEILSWARVSLAARAAGGAAAAMAHAAEYTAERVQFGRAIGEFESLRAMRDRRETEIEAARLLALEAARQIDAGSPGAADSASRARSLAAEVFENTAIDAVQMYGGYGFVNDYPVEKLMRDVRPFVVLHGAEYEDRIMRTGAD